MASATRVGDKNTGHDGCPPIELKFGSPNVFINGRGAGRKTDEYNLHGCDIHDLHPDKIVEGSVTVNINSLPAARINDAVIIAGKVMEGSSNVFIGG